MIRVELIRQLRRGRTWGLGAALVVIPILIGIANWVQRDGPVFHRNLFLLGTNTGGNFGIFMLLVMSNFFLVVVVAAVAGESVAGEATWGTLRYLLIRPVKRQKLVASKLLVAMALSLLATLLIVVVSLLVGAVLFGWTDVVTIGQRGRIPVEFIPAWEAVGRLAVASLYVTWCMFLVVAVGIFLSTLTDSTAAAVVGTIVVIVTCSVLLQVPSLEGIKPVVPTSYWDRWNGLFTADGTGDMWKGVLSSAVYTTLFSVAALVRFQRKDIVG